MKKIIYSMLMGGAMLMASCMEVDNFDEPDAHLYGRIIDKTTGKEILADQGECHVRIWEMSYSTSPSPQDIPVKQDGTYNNTKLFKGTYDMLPEGAWWPVDTVRVGLGSSAYHDFEVTPYLKLEDYACELVQAPAAAMDTLVMSCRISAPIEEGMPQITEIRPFLSLNQFCGGANHIDEYFKNTYTISIRKTWTQLKDAGDDNKVYTFKVPVKRGYIYFTRMGARVNDQYQKYNYTEIKQIEIPQ